MRVESIESVIQINFNDKKLLKSALTHSSYGNPKDVSSYNETLEFLGDSVLQFTITEFLYKNCKNKNEGELTKFRSQIVCESSLYEVAKSFNLGKYMYLSKGEESTGGRERVSILADCTEALIASIYLDKGLDITKEFILKNFHEIIDNVMSGEADTDYKTKLQEFLQKNGDVEISYEVVREEGPDHKKKFFTNVYVNSKFLGEGEGFSKKESEQAAAKNALLKINGKG